MKIGLYFKLAATNIRKNSNVYLPYILACSLTIAMSFMIFNLAQNDVLKNVRGGTIMQALLNLSICVVALFSLIFLFYSYSFLIKRRKKEFGIYNIIGMEKKHISKMMLVETMYISIISIVCGLLLGILLYRLFYLLLIKVAKVENPTNLIFDFNALIITVAIFIVIFFLILLNSIRKIHLSKPIELIKGGQVGEKEPKTNWIITILGLIFLGAGYFITLTSEKPAPDKDLSILTIAIISIIIGTYFIFVAGSIALLKILRKNKKYYYKAKHFTSISGMIYRMKQNAVGLATICVLSTIVLVMLSTTIGIASGVEFIVNERFIRDIQISAANVPDDIVTDFNKIYEDKAKECNIKIENELYLYYNGFRASVKGNVAEMNFSQTEDSSYFKLTTQQEYTRLTGESLSLEENEIYLYDNDNKIQEKTMIFGSTEYKIKGRINTDIFNRFKIDGQANNILPENLIIITKDIPSANKLYESLDSRSKMRGFFYQYYFDTNADKATQDKLADDIRTLTRQYGSTEYTDTKEQYSAAVYSEFGVILFIVSFFAVLFILAASLMIYYKQISEGYEDKERYAIMQKVGMSQQEVKRSIKSQILTIFFLPLAVAGVHLLFLFQLINKIFSGFNTSNLSIMLIFIYTFIAFSLIYSFVYYLTAKAYYKIISWKV